MEEIKDMKKTIDSAFKKSDDIIERYKTLCDKQTQMLKESEQSLKIAMKTIDMLKQENYLLKQEKNDFLLSKRVAFGKSRFKK